MNDLIYDWIKAEMAWLKTKIMEKDDNFAHTKIENTKNERLQPKFQPSNPVEDFDSGDINFARHNFDIFFHKSLTIKCARITFQFSTNFDEIVFVEFEFSGGTFFCVHFEDLYEKYIG